MLEIDDKTWFFGFLRENLGKNRVSNKGKELIQMRGFAAEETKRCKRALVRMDFSAMQFFELIFWIFVNFSKFLIVFREFS